MWETAIKLSGRVYYGPTREFGYTADLPKATKLHEVRLTGLKPATTYCYRVRSGETESETYQFKTAPVPGTNRWRMAVYGDSRSNPAVHRLVAKQIARAKVDLIVHTGDIVADGRDHDSWRKEFFQPVEPFAHSVPWVSTIGNHERDSAHYFSYMALPGNERYFGFDYANAHIVCLDSNAWIEKGRDSEQFRWLEGDLSQQRETTWTFVAFHHALFSAHARRPVNSLRWDWAPLLLDPAHRVDGVLNGHDHFYARNWRMGRLSEQPQAGVLFLTSAGGGAGLYPSMSRPYVALQKSVHHFTLFDFDSDHVTVTPIDINGKEFDRYVLTKSPTPADELCAYEVEEMSHFLRQAVAVATPVRAAEGKATVINDRLRIPTRFRIPVCGELTWERVPGWKTKTPTAPFMLQPRQALEIPLEAEVAPGAYSKDPELTIAFKPGQFRNRTLSVSPFQLVGPTRLTIQKTVATGALDGKLSARAWERVTAHALLGIPGWGGRDERVQFLADDQWIYVAAKLGSTAAEHDQVRLVLNGGKVTHTFIVPRNAPRTAAADGGAKLTDSAWRAALASSKADWTAELAVPRSLFADWSQVRLDFVHRYNVAKEMRELHLCPSYTMGTDPDRIADWKAVPLPERWAQVSLE
jgi:3',5'-cyclic AMP phosphodiesterase CpdA